MSQPLKDHAVQAFFDTSMLGGNNAAYLETLYETYLDAPESIEPKWRSFFDALPKVNGLTGGEAKHSSIRLQFENLKTSQAVASVAQGAVSTAHEQAQIRVTELIQAYRTNGHLLAQIDPLNMQVPAPVSELSLKFFGLDKSLTQTFDVGSFAGIHSHAPLSDIYEALQRTYSRTAGFEFTHISNADERFWLQQRIEASFGQLSYNADVQTRILKLLIAAEGLEKYIGAKFPGAKRFGLEGGDALIVMMDEIIQRLGTANTKEIVIGMAHRGRLNMLVNTFGKRPSDLFDEFAGHHAHDVGTGDVKYHQGFSSDITTPGGVVHVSLAFNPSHLEIVSPVVCGSVRARQLRRSDAQCAAVVPVLLHGDAAFAGQGVVMETFSMSQTRGFHIGGAIHIVINNQIGFTTSNEDDARSTHYCTDIAKMIQAPIFHVNADDPEAVLFVTQLAIDYRMAFKRDVVIDLMCYRRQGHNEADEPAATQPVMYQRIRQHPTAQHLYAERLIAQNRITAEQQQSWIDGYRDALDHGAAVANHLTTVDKPEFSIDWSLYLKSTDWRVSASTSFDPNQFKKVGLSWLTLPQDFKLHSRVQKIVDDRKKMLDEDLPADWGFAENMAYATLLSEGFPVRLSGQDCGRGTFFHRHAVLHEQATDEAYVPLQHLAQNQPDFTVIDSLLSEEAVLAFEYGYSATEPRALVIWEAQFGDFANGAQVVVDQFISSGEQKWGRLAGVTMLLPHGYEGQGPEHSSARLERFLQLCAQHNIQVCMPSTPAQVYHMLRRQVLRPMRRPLIVMSPKSFLRHRLAVSSIKELTNGKFEPVLADVDAGIDAKKVKRVVLCAGKVYYDLLEARLKAQRQDIALVRIEQLYPFPDEELKACLASYPAVQDIVWCQEEPKNQGAWFYIQHEILECLRETQKLRYIGRPSQASPAVGYASLHDEQQNALIDEAIHQ